jgi:transposase
MSELLDITENLGDTSLWVLDETGKRLESNNHRTWSPVGQPTVIERNGSHKGVNIIGATETTKHFDFMYQAYSKEDGTIKATHIIKFLEDLLQYDKSRGIRISFIQWDNARIHTAEEVKQFAQAHENELVILHQPPYSPELNAQEELWHWLKSFISKATALKNEKELLKMIRDFKAYILAHPDEFKKRMSIRNWFKKV